PEVTPSSDPASEPRSGGDADAQAPTARSGFSRRRLIASAAVAGGAGAVGSLAGFAIGRQADAKEDAQPQRDTQGANGIVTVPYFGEHQA
ncbi:hypothetical protein KCW65_26875, partial [Mycobacterium tuberculosis]|nr:hypothetical protein [Mycobacterium tuberculosis]